MKKKTSTLLIAVLICIGFYANAQTSYNVPPTVALNEFIADNYDENDLSTYVLERDGYYVLTGSINFSGDIAIVAEEGSGTRPIIIMGTDDGGASNGWGLMWTDGSVTFKSLNLKVTNDLGARGSWSQAMFNSSGSNATYNLDDCIVEYCDGVAIWNESGTGINVILTNNLFRWNGVNDAGRWHGFGTLLKNGSLEMAYIENNTFVENYCSLFMHQNGHVKNVYFNHNTIVSNAQGPIRFMLADRMVCMNNLFVDGHFGGEVPLSVLGQDVDEMPMGVYCLDYYRADSLKPAGYPAEAERVNVVVQNANFVSSELLSHWESMPDTFLIADVSKGDNGFMNERTYNMMTSQNGFDYPYFILDGMYKNDPGFNGYSIKTSEEIEMSKQMNGYDATLLSDNGQWGRYPEAEGDASWPIAEDYYDFSYTNEAYKTAAYDGYPLGDLNWWPDELSAWAEDADVLSYDEIIAKVLDNSFVLVGMEQSEASMRSNIKVYPNPASEGMIHVRGVSENEWKTVFSITGKLMIQTLENDINVSGLKAGLYFLKTGDTVTKINVL